MISLDQGLICCATMSIGAKIDKIISGGQSGVDRAALDFARDCHINWGGFCPDDGWAEDYPEAPGLLIDYPQLVTSGSNGQRTRLNVDRSDATLILFRRFINSPGTLLTVLFCARRFIPFKAIDISKSVSATELDGFIAALPPQLTINIAGPRESEDPGVYQASYRFLGDHLRRYCSKND